jgi:hypothetical protein
VSEVIRVLAVIAIIGYVIGRQLMGEPLRGKRVVLLPVILAAVGVVDLGKHGRHVEPADVVCLVTGQRHSARRRRSPLTWRCWPAWPVSGWQHGASGDGNP